jgi:hypothetical protein
VFTFLSINGICLFGHAMYVFLLLQMQRLAVTIGAVAVTTLLAVGSLRSATRRRHHHHYHHQVDAAPSTPSTSPNNNNDNKMSTTPDNNDDNGSSALQSSPLFADTEPVNYRTSTIAGAVQWSTPAIEVATGLVVKPSSIGTHGSAGNGLFALRSYRTGDIITRYTGRLLTPHEIVEADVVEWPIKYTYAMCLSPNIWIDAAVHTPASVSQDYRCTHAMALI